jgi:RNA polymerase sigma-70 factor, ECF subfamily
MTGWDRLVREHGPTVYSTAWRILGHAADTEDVVQEVFLQAHQIQQTEDVRCWQALFRRLAACRALDRLRQRRDEEPLDGLRLPTTANDPLALAMERELAARFRQAMTQLSRREATVFCLRYFDDLSNEQVAETLQISPGAVATAIHKARARLETLLLEAAQEK